MAFSWSAIADGDDLRDHAAERVVAAIEILGAINSRYNRRRQSLPCDGDPITRRIRSHQLLDAPAPADHRAHPAAGGYLAVAFECVAPLAEVAVDPERSQRAIRRLRIAGSGRRCGDIGRGVDMVGV